MASMKERERDLVTELRIRKSDLDERDVRNCRYVHIHICIYTYIGRLNNIIRMQVLII